MSNEFFIERSDAEDEALINQRLRKPGLNHVGILYSIAVILLLFVGSKFQDRELYLGLLITEFILIMLPPLIFLIMKKYDVKRVLRLNRISFLNIVLIFWIMVFALPIVGVLNLGNLMLIKFIFGRFTIPEIPVATDAVSLLVNILVIGGSAGICEEILFRGTIMRGFEKFGISKAILITAFLFGLIHLDFQRLLGTFLLGALIGFIVYRTNSIYGGMFAHFTNNSLAVVISYGTVKLAEIMKSSGMGDPEGKGSVSLDISSLDSIPREQLVASMIVWAFIILFCVIIFAGLMFGFIRSTSRKTAGLVVQRTDAKATGVIWLLPGLFVIILWYVFQGISLKGIKVEWFTDFIKAIGLS